MLFCFVGIWQRRPIFLRLARLIRAQYEPTAKPPPLTSTPADTTNVHQHDRRVQQLSRETKKQQRRTFRQLFATIGENEPPEEVVSLQNGSLTVADWAHIKQLNALRSCLQSGFQVGMRYDSRGMGVERR